MEEELEALHAIYGDAITVTADEDGEAATHHVQVTIEAGLRPIAVCFALPTGYPACAPIVDLEGLPKGALERFMPVLHSTMEELAGSAAIFAITEKVRDWFGADPYASTTGRGTDAECVGTVDRVDASPSHSFGDDVGAATVPIYHGEPLTVSKSVFLAHVARVHSKADIANVLHTLYLDSRIARATHNIRAFRFTDAASGALCSDNDDDGEDAAGGRLAHLLQLMKADDVLVVVTRWFGGVLLGPSRFKYINEVARLAVEAQPWYLGR